MTPKQRLAAEVAEAILCGVVNLDEQSLKLIGAMTSKAMNEAVAKEREACAEIVRLYHTTAERRGEEYAAFALSRAEFEIRGRGEKPGSQEDA